MNYMAYLNGLQLIETTAITKKVQRRTHRKRRINKSEQQSDDIETERTANKRIEIQMVAIFWKINGGQR